MNGSPEGMERTDLQSSVRWPKPLADVQCERAVLDSDRALTEKNSFNRQEVGGGPPEF